MYKSQQFLLLLSVKLSKNGNDATNYNGNIIYRDEGNNNNAIRRIFLNLNACNQDVCRQGVGLYSLILLLFFLNGFSMCSMMHHRSEHLLVVNDPSNRDNIIILNTCWEFFGFLKVIDNMIQMLERENYGIKKGSIDIFIFQ